jgi:outer membrane lipoprotein SlyB
MRKLLLPLMIAVLLTLSLVGCDDNATPDVYDISKYEQTEDLP